MLSLRRLMFDFIKKLFASKEAEQVEVNLEQLESWFEKKVADLDFNDSFQEYFKQVTNLKQQLKEKIKELQESEIPKEHKNVEDRIKNIVKGHRDNYARAMERFVDELSVMEKDLFSTLEDYKLSIDFNKSLDKDIDELAKRTAKSYQASQHLFFDSVEAVFKVMGQLNLLIKNFKNKEFDKRINDFEELKQKIVQLNEDKKKKAFFKKEIEDKKVVQENQEKELKNEEEESQQLKESSDYKVLLELKKKKEGKEKEIKNNENNVFSFFSKLNKPLRKYERVALDDRLIKEYLENSVKAFFNDEELKIKEQLQGLKKSLDSLKFDEKQKKNFLELIDKSSTSFLDEQFSLGKRLKEGKEKLTSEINESKIVQEIDDKDKEITDSRSIIERTKKELEDFKSKLEKINLDKTKKEIKEKINDLFFVEITFSS
jgi:hypothetical protein